MSMRRFLITFFGLVLLFVVVCPITPTPIAVLDGKAHASHAPVIPALTMVAIAAPRMERAAWNVDTGSLPLVLGGAVIDLTCARLC